MCQQLTVNDDWNWAFALNEVNLLNTAPMDDMRLVLEAPIIQWLLKGPDFGTLSRSGPMSKKSPEKGPICLLSPEVY